MTPAEFVEAITDSVSRDKDYLTTIVQTLWDSTRVHIMFDQLGNPYLKKRPKRVTDVLKFRWDSERKEQAQTVDDMKAILTALHVANYVNKKGKRHRIKAERENKANLPLFDVKGGNHQVK